MDTEDDVTVRQASIEDAAAIGQLLHDFNAEFEDETPGPEFLAERLAELLASADVLVFMIGPGPEGFSLTRIRPCIWTRADEAYLEEFYVVPARRGQGLGEALLRRTIEAVEERGCERIDLATGATDTEARGLYEKLGFRNTESGPDGPSMLFYEREL